MTDPRDAMMARRMRLANARHRMPPPWGVGSEQVTEARNARVDADPAAAETAEIEAAQAAIDLEEALAERDRYLDQLQRTAAEFANFRRRTEQERAQQRLLANEQLLREFVPILDDLQRGLNAIPAGEQDSKVAEGIRSIEQKFLATLKRNGVTQIESLGQDFDPSVHEAVEADPGGGQTVVAVYAPGYRLGEGVLRPAMVKVGQREE
jgi:molecular chaperone GrpE